MKNEIPDIEWAIKRRASKQTGTAREMFPVEVSRASGKFHRQIPGYKMSPLRALPNLAQMFGVGGIWMKDESVRLELNSFKVLGGSFALYRFIQDKLGLDDEHMTYDYLASAEVKHKLGFDCVIYVHSETSVRRIDAIRSFGARIEVIAGNYDDAVLHYYERRNPGAAQRTGAD